MSQPNQELRQSIQQNIADIRETRAEIEPLIGQFQNAVRRVEGTASSSTVKNSGHYWVAVAFADALVRVRIFLEQNFNYIEPMGLLVITRYLFELAVWLKLMETDIRYGLVYYHELLLTQLNYYRDLRVHLANEARWLREVGERESGLLTERLEKALQIPDEKGRKDALLAVGGDVRREIDRSAARAFSIYGEQAQTNGYRFQAHLVETKALPEVLKCIAELEKELESMKQNASPDVQNLLKKWNWKEQSLRVAMENEYNYIYTFTSKLLHATPASLTTDQKNLEPEEARVFLRYIHVRILDLLETARRTLTTCSQVE